MRSKLHVAGAGLDRDRAVAGADGSAVEGVALAGVVRGEIALQIAGLRAQREAEAAGLRRLELDVAGDGVGRKRAAERRTQLDLYVAGDGLALDRQGLHFVGF